jgi:ATP-dependent Clp protease ATP-binding subunit ClpX
MIPEFVGRLPCRHAGTAGCEDADQHPDRAEERAGEAVSEVLPHGRQRVEFTPGALELIAERALKRDTGARALRAVCEEIMLDLMYKLPDQQQGGKYIITEDVVEGRSSP